MNENYQIIPFENLRNRMVQTDESSSFEGSFFKDIYDQAAALTNIIVKANEDKPFYEEYVIPRQQTKAIQNVIAFTGRRGTGKTSAMLSFVDALSEGRYIGEKIDGAENQYQSLQGKQFYALQYVDSSIVSKDEDFFEILLFRMHQYLKKHVEAHNKNGYFQYDAYLSDLKEKISKLYKHYTSIRHNKQLEYSSYSLFEENIEKHDIRNEIILLVKEYIDFLNLLTSKRIGERKNNDFLLICIDDIDMSSREHLEILQCIYQYFMIPNVVVMITLNIPVISATVRKEFYSAMEISVNSEKDRLLHVSQEQTMDFLRKIIPSDMRITMPSWRKYDYRTLKPTLISFKGIGDDKKRKELFPNLEKYKWYASETPEMSPKKLIMLLLADRTKIFLDIVGLKIHFMEPDSLRNLYDLFYLLYHMKPLEDMAVNEKLHYRDLEYNRHILLNYLYFKMIPEFNFDHTIEMEFKRFQAEPMARRGRRIWDYYYKTFLNSANKERINMLYGYKFFNHEKGHYQIANYCFGELFRCLYFASRLDLFDKNFVKAVLASFAFTLPQFIEMEKKDLKEKLEHINKEKKEIEEREIKEKEIEKEEIEKRMYSKLRDVFGYSFLGTWRRELYSGFVPFRTSQMEDDNNTTKKENKISITIDIDVFKNATKENKDESLRHLLYLFLLSTKSVKDNFEVTSILPDYKIICIDADLDPTAFIVGTIRANRLKQIRFTYDGTKDLTLSTLLEQIGISGYKDDEINTIINNIVGDDKYFIWFLLKHPDITYNVVKRTISFFLYYSDANLQVRPVEYKYPYLIFKKFYVLFAEKFIEELKEYKDSHIPYDPEKFNVANISPILKWFTESEYYGNLSVHKKDCKELSISTEKMFYRYGCGMDWTGIKEHLENAGKKYYSKYYLTLGEALRAELDETDYNVFEACKEKISEEKGSGEIISANLNREIKDYTNEELTSVFKGICSGNVSKILEVLIMPIQEDKKSETTKGDTNDPAE